ncbi:MAG TPA: DNA topoisomerase I, partial [Thermoplasmata archaeon]|nr:DNA topoisomerase I [Thermoplasmata archaeon]
VPQMRSHHHRARLCALHNTKVRNGPWARDPMATSVFVICEKANAARRIASILSGGSARTGRKGRVQYHTFVGADGRDYAVIGLRGHIVDIDFPENFRRWSKKRLREMVHIEPEKVITDDGIASALRRIYDELRARGDVEIVVATDYDREGELIGLEGIQVLDLEGVPVRRARFSALTKQEIMRAFSDLGEVDRNLALSAESRREIDLLWGVILTRFLSLSARQTGKDFLSAGRVQTPTLALIDRREEEIRAFVPEPYWVIPALFAAGSEKFKGSHIAEPFRERADAEARFGRVKGARSGVVVEVHRREKETPAPAPFDTTAFLRAATGMGIQAARAMSIAEELYTQGYISYPRTDNTVYPPSLDLRGLIRMFLESDHREEAAYVLEGPMVPTRGKKSTTDHPPIHPVGVAKRGDLQRGHWQVYDLIVRRFLATLSPPARAIVTDVRIDVEHEPFVSKGYRTVDPGWCRVYPFFKSKEAPIPKIQKGLEVAVKHIRLVEKHTKPPSRFSQGGIIQEMERLGLGTKSTRHEILQKLYSRGYIRGMRIEPTRTGSAVVKVLSEHASEITEPEMTATLEEDMNAIAEGRRTKEEVVTKSRELLECVLETLEEHQEEIGNGIRKVLLQENVLGVCNRDHCGGTLYIRRSRAGKRFVGCSNYPTCTRSFPLPQYGRIEATGDVCEHSDCGAPVIRVITRGRRPWVTCINMECPGKKGAGTRGDDRDGDRTDTGEGGGKGRDPEEGDGADVEGPEDVIVLRCVSYRRR